MYLYVFHCATRVLSLLMHMVKLVMLQKTMRSIDVLEAALGRVPVWRGRGVGCTGKLPIFGRGGDGLCGIILDEPTWSLKVFYQA